MEALYIHGGKPICKLRGLFILGVDLRLFYALDWHHMLFMTCYYSCKTTRALLIMLEIILDFWFLVDRKWPFGHHIQPVLAIIILFTCMHLHIYFSCPYISLYYLWGICIHYAYRDSDMYWGWWMWVVHTRWVFTWVVHAEWVL